MTEKRTGGRDISELKARLGLKKGSPAGRAGTTTGVVPPPGVNLPPPPGSRTQQVSVPVPNAADDPFGAMNAMAQIGQVQRAPEIVINVNDGAPVEHVGASKRFAQIGKYAIIGLIPLILGLLVGATGRTNSIINQGTVGAGGIVSHVTVAKRSLGDLQSILDGAKKKGPIRPSKELTASLKPFVEQLKPDSNKIFLASQRTLNADLSVRVLQFFSAVSEIQQQLENHQRTAAFDDVALTDAAEQMKKAVVTESENAPLASMANIYPYRYGVVLSNPAPGEGTKPFGAQVVELGPPYCTTATGQDEMSKTGTCPGPVSGFAYRTGESIGWTKGVIASVSPDAPVPAGKIVPILSTKTADALVRGPEPTAAEAIYAGTLNSISKKLEDLIVTANTLETELNQRAKAGKKFTFFM